MFRIREEVPSLKPERRFSHHKYLWPSICELLPSEGPLRIMDAGCGSGFFAANLAKLGHRVTGYDVSPVKVARARENYPHLRYETASVYDDLSTFTPEGGWDVVLAAEVIEHLYSPRTFLSNMHKYLRPSGYIILTTPYHGYVKNLALGFINGWDRHFTAELDGGHIKFWSTSTLSNVLQSTGFGKPIFRYAGRFPLLWKSMVCRARRA